MSNTQTAASSKTNAVDGLIEPDPKELASGTSDPLESRAGIDVPALGQTIPIADVGAIITSDDYEAATGEPLSTTLDIGTWGPAERLMDAFTRLQQEVQEATADESEWVKVIRKNIFPIIGSRTGAPPNAGVYQASEEDVRRAQAAALFNGQTEACDGVSNVYDTIPLTIVQLGVSLVSYGGDHSTYAHRLYRRDMRVRGIDTVEEQLTEFLDRRQKRGGIDQPSKRDQMSDMFRRAIMTFAERAVLSDRSTAPWRIGHGNPIPYELVTGSGSAELIIRSIAVLKRLILDHKRFLFVPSAASERALYTIGDALKPLEYAVIDSVSDRLRRIVSQGGYRGQEFRLAKKHLEEFAVEVGDRVLVGVYRVSAHSPAQVFYAHTDHVSEAALIAMADSILQEHRGFPMLLDLADKYCRNLMGAETLSRPAVAAYADAGEPHRYQPERSTRT